MTTKAVLVTGAARRLGKRIALYLAANGYDIALHYHNSHVAAQQTKQEIQELGQKCEIFLCDLSQPDKFDAVLDHMFEAFPNCDSLVNNASVFERMKYTDTKEEFFDEQFAVNFKAPFFLTQGFARRNPDCSIVNIVDTAVTTNSVSHFAYLLSKKSLLEFTAMAARDLAPRGRVNAVLPGTVLPSHRDSAEYIEKLEHTLPAGRLATVEEVSLAVYNLLQNDALNGQNIFIDGGAHLL